MAITYDRIGNPVSDGTWAYTWGAGTQLRKLEKPGETITFDYDASGKRVRKTSTSQGTTEYTMMGDKLVHLNRRSVDMHFWYNDLGKPQVAWYNCDSYYYVYNQQGDVIALVNSRTNQEAVAYAYDAWGKQISCTGAMASTLGVENPFRYRGYIYDEETGWYYLMSRYYRPEWGRFLSADRMTGKTGALLSHSLFSYCYNNPVNLSDTTGFAPVAYADVNWAEVISPTHKEFVSLVFEMFNTYEKGGVTYVDGFGTVIDMNSGKSYGVTFTYKDKDNYHFDLFLIIKRKL